MPTITKNALPSEAQFGGTPYGNHTNLSFNLTTNAVGAVVNSDLATGIAAADVVRFGILPAGARLLDAVALITTGFTATVTGSIGFAYVDGVDSTAVPQDAAYFFAAGLTIATAQRTRATAIKPVVTLPKDAYLILTTAVAANAKVAVMDVFVDTLLLGPA